MTDAPVRPDARLMQGVIPYLAMAGRAAEACEFYARAFAADRIERLPMPDGAPGLMHAQLVINGGTLMMTDHGGGTAPSYGFGHLQLVVADGRAWWDRAVAAGCAVLAPYEQQFWGDDWGLLEDPFGIKWAVLETGSPA
ncbi:VOC family protein [Roseococcus thiosulfatophilus]|uniref:VOC family protein n=1 Tax=Roseococcus thiosulfatophilus TaxID=35813 RepID=UPI001A8F7675|nr:glyoxalase/bleomycin resistance/extradiol dioxygenase family protein [Roseococcus thiosulfatophilus]